MEYRIEELNGAFTIEVQGCKDGLFFWSTKVCGWHGCNIWGGVHCAYPIWQPFCKSFSSLDKAKNKIKEWRAKPIYHEVS